MVASPSKYLTTRCLRLTRCIASAGLAALIITPARADGWSGAVGIASDKVYRGLSQTGGRPSVLLDLAYHGDTGWFAGLGLASVRRGTADSGAKTLAEVTASAGRGWQIGSDWSASASLVRYAHPGSPRQSYDDYDELSVTLGWKDRVFAVLALSPDAKGRTAAGQPVTGRTLASELGWQQPLAGRLAFDTGIGRFDLHDIGGTSYGYGHAGLSWRRGPAAWYLTYIASRDIAGAPDVGGRRWVASALWSF